MGTVYQYEVGVALVPPPAADTPAGSASSKQGPKNKWGRRSGAGLKVLGTEAHAVLSYLLDTTAAGEPGRAKDAWVYDGGATLFTSVGNDLLADVLGEADGSSGVARQPDGSVRIEVPLAVNGPAAGTYQVTLRRTAILDVKQSLRDGQLQQARQPSPMAASSTGESLLPTARPAGSLTAAALAVVELVSRAAAVWKPETVRSGAGTFVSYKQEDKQTKMEGLLPLKVLNGFRAAVSVVAVGPTLTLDFASTVVAEDGPLLPQLEATLGRPDLAKQLGDKFNASRIEAALTGLEVKSSHRAITWKLSGGLTKQSARDTMFQDESGRKLSVETYYKERYDVTLQRPDLPCALDRKGGALPLELLTVVRSQKRMSRMDARQKATYIRSAAKAPTDRLKAAREALKRTLGGVAGEVARSFGLSAAADFLKVPARLLPGPLLEVVRGRTGVRGGVEPRNAGEWASPGVAAAGKWQSGAVLSYLDPNKDDATVAQLVSRLGSSLEGQAAAHLPADMPVVWATAPRQGQNADKEAESWMRQVAIRAERKFGLQPQLVLVILPGGRSGGGVYEAIKTVGDGAMRIPTQFIDPFKAGLAKGGPSPSYVNLLALGVNVKLGGITTRLAGRPADWAPVLEGKRLMVIGADVSRGPAAAFLARGDTEGELEVAARIEYAAVLGSVDSHAVQFVQQISVQSAGNRDVVIGMRESAAGLLRAYGAANGAPASPGTPLPASCLPEVLLVYRDGVADSMFDVVLAEEYTAIKQACTDVGGAGYEPKVTFTVVQKSHNTRLFPASPADAHRSGNVLPGTVVDQGVVDGAAFDFFLNSHAGIQGTNRAPRYTVLVDEVGFTSESLQLLTFGLCHTHPTCHRTLSLPPAARLADRAADRARIIWRSRVASLTGAGSTKGRRGAFWHEMLPAAEAASYVV